MHKKISEFDAKKQELNCGVNVIPIIEYLEYLYGGKKTKEIIEPLGLSISFLSNKKNWISYKYYCKLLDILVEITNDENAPFKAPFAGNTLNVWSDLFYATFLSALNSPKLIFTTVFNPNIYKRYTKIGDFKIIQNTTNTMIVNFKFIKGYKQDKNNCKVIQGYMSSATIYSGLPPAEIEHTICAAEGADECVYKIKWKDQRKIKRLIWLLFIPFFILEIIFLNNFKNFFEILIISFLSVAIFFLITQLLKFFRRLKNTEIYNAEKNNTLLQALEKIESDYNEILKNKQKIEEYSQKLEEKVKERTKELELANNRLKNLDKLKNDFIANITHNFRSPLTAILNVADLALKFQDNDKHENKENYKIIYDSSIRLKTNIDRLLELARMDAGGIKLYVARVDIISVINTIVKYYSSSIMGTNIKIIKQIPDNEITNFYTDIERIEEILNNVLSNAIKFVDPNNGEILIKLFDMNNKIRIIIKDNGIGIPKNKLKIIFNRFEQAQILKKEYFRGTGIGLAKQLTGYLKGRIWAESEGHDKGSSFIIELLKGKKHFRNKDFCNQEINRKNIKHIKEKETIIKTDLEIKMHKNELKPFFTELNKENKYNIRKAKILIIDDDKYIRDIIKKYLSNNGYKNFIMASNGILGLDAVYDYLPDIIICDYNMPYMRGDKLHDELLSNPNLKNIPFIFLSAIADNDLIIERRKKGASAYLKKPIDEKDLLLTTSHNIKKHFEYLKTFQLASIDELTGLYNRRFIIKNLERELSIRKDKDMSIIFIDLDYFKKINDTYGHHAGDKILETIGKILKSKLRDYDLKGRYGGEEFIIILPDTNLKHAKIVAEMIKKKIQNKSIKYQGNIHKITGSFGISSLLDNEKHICKILGIQSLENIYEIKNKKLVNLRKIKKIKLEITNIMINMADQALYEAKKTKCNICKYSSINSDIFNNNKCPKCKSKDLNIGRNKIEIFE